jgi:hypothetical protein
MGTLEVHDRSAKGEVGFDCDLGKFIGGLNVLAFPHREGTRPCAARNSRM